MFSHNAIPSYVRTSLCSNSVSLFIDLHMSPELFYSRVIQGSFKSHSRVTEGSIINQGSHKNIARV